MRAIIAVVLLFAQYVPAGPVFGHAAVCTGGSTGYIQSAGPSTGGAVAHCAATFASSVTTGSTVFISAATWTGTTGTATDSKGNTYVQVNTSNNGTSLGNTETFMATNVTGGSSFTIDVTQVATVPDCSIIEFSPSIGTALDTQSVNTGATSVTSFPATPVTTTASGDVLLSITHGAGTGTTTPPSGFTLNGSGGQFASCKAGSAGSYGGTWGSSGSSGAPNGWSVNLIAIKP